MLRNFRLTQLLQNKKIIFLKDMAYFFWGGGMEGQ